MLLARYRAARRTADLDRIEELDDAHLIVEAERSLGRPLQLNHLPVLVDVLREHWVPVMDDEDGRPVRVGQARARWRRLHPAHPLTPPTG